MRRLFLLLLIASASRTAVAGNAITTVILVRHAEKASATADPTLSEAGSARAAELARVLADQTIDAVYATQFHRTQDTAALVAAEHHVKVQVIKADAELAKYAVAEVVNSWGKTLLFVGHSNTIPDLIEAFGVAQHVTIADDQYDELFIVTLATGVPARLLRLWYWAASKP